MIVSGFRAALDLETYPLSNFIRLRRAERAKPGRGKPMIKSPHYFSCPCFGLVALKLLTLVLLISRLVACSAKIFVDKQTDTQNDYCNNNNNNNIAVTQRAYAHCDTISNRKCRMRVINYCT